MIPKRAKVLNIKNKPSSKQINKTSQKLNSKATQFQLDQARETP